MRRLFLTIAAVVLVGLSGCCCCVLNHVAGRCDCCCDCHCCNIADGNGGCGGPHGAVSGEAPVQQNGEMPAQPNGQ